jgi:hypothetical protein
MHAQMEILAIMEILATSMAQKGRGGVKERFVGGSVSDPSTSHICLKGKEHDSEDGAI